MTHKQPTRSHHEADDLRITVEICLGVFLLALGYAIVRYNIVREVPWDNLPLFISNKAVALTATILIGLSFILGPLARFWPKAFVAHLSQRKYLGIAGFAVASLHALMSAILLSSAYYPRFFGATGKMNLLGETSMLTGIIAFLLFGSIALISIPSIAQTMQPGHWQFHQRIGYAAYFLVLLHVGIMGWSGWFRPESWQYGLASISLIAALVIFIVLFVRLLVSLWPMKHPTS